MHNKNYGYAFFEEDEEIDYKGLINELRQKDINEKNIDFQSFCIPIQQFTTRMKGDNRYCMCDTKAACPLVYCLFEHAHIALFIVTNNNIHVRVPVLPNKSHSIINDKDGLFVLVHE